MSVDIATLGIDFRSVAERSPSGMLLLDAEGRCIYVNGRGCQILGRSVEEVMGMHYLDMVAEPERQRLQERLAQQQMAGTFDVQIDRPDQRRCYVWGSLFEVNPRVRVLAMTDRTEAVRARLEIQAQSQIASRLTYGGSLESIMDELAANVGEATGCGSCAVILCQPAPRAPRVVGGWRLAPGFAERHAAALQAGMPLAAAEVMQTGRALVRRDAPCFLERYAAERGLTLDPALCPEAIIVCLPLNYHKSKSCPGQVLGTLNCYFAEHFAPDERDMLFLQAIADQAAVSIENARLFDEVQHRAAQEAALEERQRLARDLHDSVSQALFGIGLGARTALKLLDAHGDVREPLNYVLSLAEAGLAEMRALIFELHPQSLESEGLVAALRKQVTAVGSRHSINVSSHLGDEPSLTAAAREALYRVAQESLNNIVKHSGAGAVSVSLQSTNSTILLTITDDGVGFDTGQSFPGHLGLTSMEERMEKVGGRLVVTSASGRGTSVRAEVPGDVL